MDKFPVTPFLILDRRAPIFAQAYRAATKDAVTWLMRRADERAETGTKQGRADARVLNRAAADMAREAKAVAFPLDDTEGGE